LKETTTKPGRIGRAAANLFPGYFALVMATGISSVAAHLSGMGLLARALLAVNLVAYPVLWALLLIRLIRFFPRVKADITDHVRGPGFFTTVAGTCVLGSQLVIIAGRTEAAGALWLVGLLLWGLIMYTFFTSVTVREDKPPLETGLNGAWLDRFRQRRAHAAAQFETGLAVPVAPGEIFEERGPARALDCPSHPHLRRPVSRPCDIATPVKPA
jgi:hypothetical protein